MTCLIYFNFKKFHLLVKTFTNICIQLLKYKHLVKLQLLVRFYGHAHEGEPDTKINELLVFTLLSERKLGPKLLGVFPGGRLEQYIKVR